MKRETLIKKKLSTQSFGLRPSFVCTVAIFSVLFFVLHAATHLNKRGYVTTSSSFDICALRLHQATHFVFLIQEVDEYLSHYNSIICFYAQPIKNPHLLHQTKYQSTSCLLQWITQPLQGSPVVALSPSTTATPLFIRSTAA